MATKKPTQKPLPKTAELKNTELEPTSAETKSLNQTPVVEQVPEATATPTELPKDYDEKHAFVIDGDVRVIKSTKLKYQRNRTAVAYRILQIYPLPDILGMDAGVLDPDRDGDQILFDFLVAVFDDVEFVKKHYDDMSAADIERIVTIFCEVNGITEKEEQAKNRAAKGTKA